MDNPIQRRFHADPRVRAVEPLLQERIPSSPPLHHISTREGLPSVGSVGEVAPSVSQFETPHTATPKTQLLCNGRYGLMMTNAGGGYSRWGDLRSRAGGRIGPGIRGEPSVTSTRPIRIGCGATPISPTGGKVEEYSVNFALDRAVFRRVDHGIQSETEIVVSPEDDVEIRRITLINRSLRTRRLDLTSYVELSHGAAQRGPAASGVQQAVHPDRGAA